MNYYVRRDLDALKKEAAELTERHVDNDDFLQGLAKVQASAYMHIGKSPRDGAFVFHGHKELGLVSSSTWRGWLDDHADEIVITDEHAELITIKELWKKIENTYSKPCYAVRWAHGSNDLISDPDTPCYSVWFVNEFF